MSAKKHTRTRRESDAARPRYVRWAAYLAPPLASVAVFSFALKNGFVWDDLQYLLENPFMKLGWKGFFAWAFTAFYAANYHPLTWLSHRLDFALWGGAAGGHHLTSVVIHAVNVVLVVHLVRRLVSLAAGSEEGRLPLLAALFAGLVFGVHPLRVESVAWVAERKDVLCALFFLLAVISHLNYARGNERRWYRLSLVFFLLALLAKPMAVSLPVVLIILDFYPLRRLGLGDMPRGARRALLEKVPFVLLAAASCVLTVFAQHAGGATGSVAHASFPVRLMVAARGLVFYLEKTVLPLGLAPLYPYPDALTWIHAASGLLVAAAAVFIVLKRKKYPWLAAGFSYYLITLLPVLGLVQVGQQSAADRYSYLPILGPLVLVSVGWAKLAAKERPAARYTAAALLVAATLGLGAAAVRYESHWRNTVTLFTREIEVFGERAPSAYNNRGVAYEKMNRFRQALSDYEKALEIKPDYPDALVNRARLKRMMRDFEAALHDLEKAVALAPGHLKAHNSLGVVLDMMGRHRHAGEEFRKALEINPYSYQARFNAALHHLEHGDPDKAEEHARKAISLSPRVAKAHELLARIQLKKGQAGEAEKSLRKAAGLDPRDPSPRLMLARFLLSSGRRKEAVEVLDQALAVRPDLGEAYFLRGLVNLRRGLRERGVEDIKKAASLGHPKARQMLQRMGPGAR